MGTSDNLVGVRLNKEFLEKINDREGPIVDTPQEIIRAALYLYFNLEPLERLRWHRVYSMDSFEDTEWNFGRELYLAEEAESGEALQLHNGEQRNFLFGWLEAKHTGKMKYRIAKVKDSGK